MWSRPYWRKAPLALLGRLPLLAAVLAGALLVALAAASSTLFSTAAGNAALRAKLTEITPFGAGLYVSWPAAGADVRSTLARQSRQVAAVRRAAAGIPALRAPVVTELGDPVLVEEEPGGATMQIRPVAREGFAAHVHRLSPPRGGGLWIASSVARFLQVPPGGSLHVLRPPSLGVAAPPAPLRVAATYRPLWAQPVQSYWANFSGIVYPPPAGQDGPTPPTFAFGTPQQILRLERQARAPVSAIVELPVETHGITLRRAERIRARFDGIAAAVRVDRSPLARTLGCSPQLRDCDAHSSLAAAIALARRDVAAVSAPARLLSDIGVLIALGVFAAAGAYLVVRRRAEARLLYARGVAAPAFAAHAALEALLPTLAGGLAGFGLALAFVRVSQPTGALDAVALRSAAVRAAIGLAVGLALLAGAAALSFLRQYEATAWSARRLGVVPWELAPVGLAAWLLVDVAHGGGVDGRGTAVGAHPSLEVFLLPLLLLAGVSGLALRAVRPLLVRAARREAPLPVYLGLRRLAAGRGALVLLATLCAVALGLLFYAQTLAGSLAHSAREKAYVAVGSDVQGTIDASDPLPRGFPYPLTKVEIEYAAASVGGPAGAQVDVIAVDPSSIARVIRWDPAWGQAPSRWVGGLDGAGPLAAIVPPRLAGLRALWVSEARVPVHVAAVVRAFPGMTDQPFVVVSQSALAHATARAGAAGALAPASALVWARGPAAKVKAALAVSPLRPYFPLTVDDVLRNPDIAVATHTFSFLRALGFAVGALALVGILLHLYARQRGQAIASAFARRMGLRRRTELLALWLELAALLGFAAVLAAVVAVATAGPVVRHTDPIPKYRPGPVLVVPWTWAWATLALLVAFAAAGAVLTAALARRADVGEELRLV